MNIYVGNLSFEVSEDDLKVEFEAFGQVDSVAIIKDKFSDRSRGFGFVEMADDTEAQAAITALHGKEVKGRALVVNQARTPSAEGRGGKGGRPRRDRY